MPSLIDWQIHCICKLWTGSIIVPDFEHKQSGKSVHWTLRLTKSLNLLILVKIVWIACHPNFSLAWCNPNKKMWKTEHARLTNKTHLFHLCQLKSQHLNCSVKTQIHKDLSLQSCPIACFGCACMTMQWQPIWREKISIIVNASRSVVEVMQSFTSSRQVCFCCHVLSKWWVKCWLISFQNKTRCIHVATLRKWFVRNIQLFFLPFASLQSKKEKKSWQWVCIWCHANHPLGGWVVHGNDCNGKRVSVEWPASARWALNTVVSLWPQLNNGKPPMNPGEHFALQCRLQSEPQRDCGSIWCVSYVAFVTSPSWTKRTLLFSLEKPFTNAILPREVFRMFKLGLNNYRWWGHLGPGKIWHCGFHNQHMLLLRATCTADTLAWTPLLRKSDGQVVFNTHSTSRS